MTTQTNYSELRRFSDALGSRDLDYPVIRVIVDELQALAGRKHATILDYGAGNTPYRHLFGNGRYLTADVQQNATNSIDIILSDSKIGLSDASIDLVLCIFVLEHVPDYKATITELIRVLKPSGTLFVAVPYISREHETPHDYLRYTSFMAQRMFAGCPSVTIRKAGNAWHAIFTLLYEMHIKNGEQATAGIFSRVIHRLARAAAPVLNHTLFAKLPQPDDGIFTALIITAIKEGLNIDEPAIGKSVPMENSA